MTVGARLTLFLAVKLPLFLFAFVLGNIVKRVAPGFLFQRLQKMNGGMLADSALQLNSIEDMQFLGSAVMLRVSKKFNNQTNNFEI